MGLGAGTASEAGPTPSHGPARLYMLTLCTSDL